ncbi:MAG TPA: hypothetical protein PLJ60_21195 [Chryseolinea sp.]|jgi:hypothetical protein|nr:hypothetical protein [Chryseolinea sp.]
MTDYIELVTTTPISGPCAQVGMEDYINQARFEARTYIGQLQRVYGDTPVGSHFKIIRCPHDFGTYLDIRFYYDNEDQRHVAYMDNSEQGCDRWDELALSQLEKLGYCLQHT